MWCVPTVEISTTASGADWGLKLDSMPAASRFPPSWPFLFDLDFEPTTQGEFGGDPGGIRTRDLDLERVASLARLDDGVVTSEFGPTRN